MEQEDQISGGYVQSNHNGFKPCLAGNHMSDRKEGMADMMFVLVARKFLGRREGEGRIFTISWRITPTQALR